MKAKLFKYDFIIPIIASLLFFFTLKLELPYYIYSFVIVIFGMYFFPIKDILFFNEYKNSKRKIIFLSLLANLALSLILIMSIMYLYIIDGSSLKLLINILTIVNILFLIYFYLFDNTRNRIIIHFCFIFFTAALIGIP